MRPMSTGVQRFCAIVLALVALWLAYWVLIHWWLVAPLQDIVQEEALLQASYQRYTTLAAQRGAIQAQLDSKQRNPLPPGSLLKADSEQAATAQVMQLVFERLASSPASGIPCTLMNRLPQAAQTAGELLRVRVDVDLECGIESLAGTLYRLENESPMLKVAAFNLRQLQALRPGQGRLGVKLQVIGFMEQVKVENHD